MDTIHYFLFLFLIFDRSLKIKAKPPKPNAIYKLSLTTIKGEQELSGFTPLVKINYMLSSKEDVLNRSMNFEFFRGTFVCSS